MVLSSPGGWIYQLHFAEGGVDHRLGTGTLQLGPRQIALHVPIRNYYWVRNALWLARQSYTPLAWRLYFISRTLAFLVHIPDHRRPAHDEASPDLPGNSRWPVWAIGTLFGHLDPYGQCVSTASAKLAGAPGFEPGNGGTKNRCLTTWRRPNAFRGAAVLSRRDRRWQLPTGKGRRMTSGRHSPLAGHPAAGYKSGLPDDFENVGV